MPHLSAPQFLGQIVVILTAAKLFGALAKRIGQPAVLGELLAGVLLGKSLIGVVDPGQELHHVFAEIGVIVLLFEIGLETDLKKLLRAGRTATVVALVGVVLPFILGYGICRLLGLNNLISIVAAASLTATSIGITARVLSDLNRLQEPESQIILGAAVLDDVIGLIILAIVTGLAQGEAITLLGVARITGFAFGFLAGTLLIGRLITPPLVRWLDRFELPGASTTIAIVLAFGLAWLATVCESAMIMGAFVAGLLLRETPRAHDMHRGIAHLGYLFVPVFFVMVGAAIDVRALNPSDSSNWPTLGLGLLLIVAAVLGKFLAGFAPFWFRGNKKVIGVGMIPRGEVGLIFAQMGLANGILSSGHFSAVVLMVMVTTIMAPPLLTWLYPPVPTDRTSRLQDVSNPAGVAGSEIPHAPLPSSQLGDAQDDHLT